MKPCVKRRVVHVMAKTGEVSSFEQCFHQSCSKFSLPVIDSDCDICPLRQEVEPRHYEHTFEYDREFGVPKVLEDGTLVYEQNGWEPPQDHEGYRRKSNDPRSPEAWMFVPTWNPCQHRKFVNGVKPCGCLKINAVCTCEACPLYRLGVTAEQCADCQFAEPVRSAL